MSPHATWIVAALALTGCPSNTTFTNTDADVTEVDGAAAVIWSPSEFAWTDLSVGITYSLFLTVESVGDIELQIYQAQVINNPSGAFYVPDFDDGASIKVEAGNTRELTVTVTLTEDAAAEAEIWLQTNDGDNLNVYIPLSAAPAGSGSDTAGGDDTSSGKSGAR